MKAIKNIPILMLAIAMLAACSNDPKEKISRLEQKMASENFVFDSKGIEMAEELMQLYTQYAETKNDAPESPGYLHHAAEISLNLNNYQQALEWYNRIIYQYPNYNKVPECLFMIGFIYENYLQNFGKAKEVYESFIERYPDHDLADDAAICIKNLGKSPEELLREFELLNEGGAANPSV